MNLGRSRVNGDVKKDFEAHEDFLITVANAAILRLVLNHFKLTDVSSQIDFNEQNLDYIKQEFSKIVRKFYVPYNSSSVLEPHKILTVKIVRGTNADLPHVNTFMQVLRTLGVNEATLNVGNSTFEVSYKEPSDDVNSYWLNLLNWLFHLLLQKWVVKEGDADRNVTQVKRFLPFFLSHTNKQNTNRSLYATQCIDFILKTCVTQTPSHADRVRASFVVNTEGGVGQNKESDLMKENLNKLSKTLIKNLKSNKTEAAIQRVTGAAKGLQEISHNLESALGCSKRSSHHKKPCMEKDIMYVLQEFTSRKFLDFIPGRKTEYFCGMKADPFATISKDFDSYVMQVSQRLCKGRLFDIEGSL